MLRPLSSQAARLLPQYPAAQHSAPGLALSAPRLATSAITKRRTTHGHLVAYFVPKKKPAKEEGAPPAQRAPLRPLKRPEQRQRQQQRGWSRFNRRYPLVGGWR